MAWVERDGELIPFPVKSMLELYGHLRPDPGQQALTSILREERQVEGEAEDV